MQFADFDSGSAHRIERGERLLKFHGEMAGVIIHAQIRVETWTVFLFGAKLRAQCVRRSTRDFAG